MAFNRTPAQDTFQTKPIPLMHEWESRTAANVKSTAATNIVYDVIRNETTGENYVQALKRNGTEIKVTIPEVDERVVGVYHWSIPNLDRLVVVTAGNSPVTDSHIYLYSTSDYTTPAATVVNPGFNNGIREVGFVEFLYDSGTIELIICDTVIFGTLTITGTWTVCADADRPVAFNPYPVFLDGYLFLSDTAGNIYNSNLNQPLVWSAGDVITAEAYPDQLYAIMRTGTYIAALGKYSTEWFYDAANPTGTPLAVVSGATQSVGVITAPVAIKNNIYFIGKSFGGVPSLWMIEGTKMVEIPNSSLSRWMLGVEQFANNRGHILSFHGGVYYAVSLTYIEDTDTYYFDLKNKLWHKLLLGSSTTGPQLVGSTLVASKNSNTYEYATFFAEDASRYVYKVSPSIYQDAGVNFTCTLTSRPMDFGTQRIKFGSRMVLNCDTTSASSNMEVSWSDDDEATFTTARNVDLSNPYKQIYALGAFRRRTWKYSYADNYPMRWEASELDYNQGQF